MVLAGGRDGFCALQSVSAIAVAVAALIGPARPAGASTPSLTWQGAERVGVYCQVTSSEPGVRAFEAAFCGRVLQLVAQGAPTPVTAVSVGDRAFIQPGTVTLLVQAAVHPARAVAPEARGRMVAFTIRPFRAGAEDAVLFGTAPRAVLIPQSMTAGSRALDAALEAALSETLPWRSLQSTPD